MKNIMYEGKVFCLLKNDQNGEVTNETLFHYHQEKNIISAEYEGGEILKGHLIGKILENGDLDIRYHHINKAGEIKIGKSLSTPEILKDDTIKLKENWKWLCGDMSSGYSETVEIENV